MRLSKDLVTFGIAFACIALVAIGFVGKSVFFHASTPDLSTITGRDAAAKKYPTLPADALRLKMSKGDPIDIIDIRPQAFYAEEHIPFSHRMDMTDLSGYAPSKADTTIILIALADDMVSMEQANAILKNASVPYAFLEDGIASWKAINGNLVSVGDPNSAIDRSKVSFKTAEETKAVLDGGSKNFFAILDTRSASAYRSGHIPGAINIPLDELEGRMNDLPAGRQVITYGANDVDSFRSAVRLYDLNIFSPYAIENGFAAWTEKKYGVEK
jgi:rhodanese-related sulfurtransferase